MSVTCVAAFAEYTGAPYDDHSNLDFGLFYPLQDAWTAGERDVSCYAFHVDGTPLTGSLRAPATSSVPSS